MSEMSVAVKSVAAHAFAASLALETKTTKGATDRLNEHTQHLTPGELRTVADAAKRLSDHCERLLNQ